MSYISSPVKSVQLVDTTIDTGSASGTITLGTTLTDYTKAVFIPTFVLGTSAAPSRVNFKITSTTVLTWGAANSSGSDAAFVVRGYVIEFK